MFDPNTSSKGVGVDSSENLNPSNTNELQLQPLSTDTSVADGNNNGDHDNVDGAVTPKEDTPKDATPNSDMGKPRPLERVVTDTVNSPRTPVMGAMGGMDSSRASTTQLLDDLHSIAKNPITIESDYITLARPLKGHPNTHCCCIIPWRHELFTWQRTESVRLFLKLYILLCCSLAMVLWIEFFASSLLEWIITCYSRRQDGFWLALLFLLPMLYVVDAFVRGSWYSMKIAWNMACDKNGDLESLDPQRLQKILKELKLQTQRKLVEKQQAIAKLKEESMNMKEESNDQIGTMSSILKEQKEFKTLLAKESANIREQLQQAMEKHNNVIIGDFFIGTCWRLQVAFAAFVASLLASLAIGNLGYLGQYGMRYTSVAGLMWNVVYFIYASLIALWTKYKTWDEAHPEVPRWTFFFFVDAVDYDIGLGKDPWVKAKMIYATGIGFIFSFCIIVGIILSAVEDDNNGWFYFFAVILMTYYTLNVVQQCKPYAIMALWRDKIPMPSITFVEEQQVIYQELVLFNEDQADRQAKLDKANEELKNDQDNDNDKDKDNDKDEEHHVAHVKKVGQNIHFLNSRKSRRDIGIAGFSANNAPRSNNLTLNNNSSNSARRRSSAAKGKDNNDNDANDDEVDMDDDYDDASDAEAAEDIGASKRNSKMAKLLGADLDDIFGDLTQSGTFGSANTRTKKETGYILKFGGNGRVVRSSSNTNNNNNNNNNNDSGAETHLGTIFNAMTGTNKSTTNLDSTVNRKTGRVYSEFGGFTYRVIKESFKLYDRVTKKDEKYEKYFHSMSNLRDYASRDVIQARTKGYFVLNRDRLNGILSNYQRYWLDIYRPFDEYCIERNIHSERFLFGFSCFKTWLSRRAKRLRKRKLNGDDGRTDSKGGDDNGKMRKPPKSCKEQCGKFSSRCTIWSLDHICNIFIFLIVFIVLFGGYYMVQTLSSDDTTSDIDGTTTAAANVSFSTQHYGICDTVYQDHDGDAPMSVLDVSAVVTMPYRQLEYNLTQIVDLYFNGSYELIYQQDEEPVFFHMRHKEYKVDYIAVRGTKSTADMVQDLSLFVEVTVFQMLSWIFPFLTALPETFVRTIVYYASFTEGIINPTVREAFSDDVYSYAYDYLEDLYESGEFTNLYIVGHSLGGAIAQVVASKLYELDQFNQSYISSFGLNSPGTLYSSGKFEFKIASLQFTSVSVLTDRDPVSGVDLHSGVIQEIECTQDLFSSCHSDWVAVCELYWHCDRGTAFNDDAIYNMCIESDEQGDLGAALGADYFG